MTGLSSNRTTIIVSTFVARVAGPASALRHSEETRRTTTKDPHPATLDDRKPLGQLITETRLGGKLLRTGLTVPNIEWALSTIPFERHANCAEQPIP